MLHAQREAPAQHPPQPEHDQRRGAEVAEQQAAGALVGEHDQRDRERDRHRHVRARGEHVGARALVHAQLRVGHLQVRERPQAERRAVDQQRVVEAEQQRARAAPANATTSSEATVVVHATAAVAERAMRSRRARVLVVEVEADERLADPDAQEDARRGSPPSAAIRPRRRRSGSRWRVYSGSVISARPLATMSPNW